MKTKLKAAPARELYSGFIDRTGAVVIEPRFHNVDGFSEGLALVDLWK